MQDNIAANLPVSPKQQAELTSQMPVPRAIRLVCRAELTTLADMLPVALLGEEIEGVHKVRVTVRRLRTCLKLGKPYFKKSVIQSLRGDLKEVGQVFGKVRDLDVLQLGFRLFITGEETNPEFDRNIWMPTFGRTGGESRAAMRNCAESQFFSDLIGRMNDFVRPDDGLKPEEKRSDLPGSLRVFLTPILKEQLAAMLEFRTSLENPPPYAEFHNLRLLAKAHRYTLEFFQSVLKPEPAAAMIENLVALQDHLGELNDCVVAENLLQNALGDGLPQEVRQAVSDFRAHKSAERAVLTKTFYQIWAAYQVLNPNVLLESAAQP